MKKINTILITSALFLGVSNVQADSLSASKSNGVNISQGVMVAWLGDYRGNSGHLTKKGKQDKFNNKVTKLNDQAVKIEQKVAKIEKETAKFQEKVEKAEYLRDLQKVDIEKSTKEFQALKKSTANIRQIDAASDLLRIKHYRLERADKKVFEAKKETLKWLQKSRKLTLKAKKLRDKMAKNEHKLQELFRQDGDLLDGYVKKQRTTIALTEAQKRAKAKKRAELQKQDNAQRRANFELMKKKLYSNIRIR